MASNVTYSAPAGRIIYAGKFDPLGASCSLGGQVLPFAFSGSAGVPVAAPAAGEKLYRTAQKYLFQPIEIQYRPSVFEGGVPYFADWFSPTYYYINLLENRKWGNAGGDWIDANEVQQGTTAWATRTLNDVGSGAAAYTANITTLLDYVQTHAMPCAIYLYATGTGPRTMATQLSAHPPSISVTYYGGATATLACRIVAAMSTGSTQPLGAQASSSLPVMMEFETPEAEIASATINFYIDQHFSGLSTAQFMIVRPVREEIPYTGDQGLAAKYGPLDEGLEADPDVIYVHTPKDGDTIGKFVIPGAVAFSSESNYDPAIWNNGPQDTNKWPHTTSVLQPNGKYKAKWINPPSTDFGLVNSTDTSRPGFKPLHPGLAAFYSVLKAQPGVVDGGEYGNSGTLAANMRLQLPEPDFGNLGHFFLRFEAMFGAGYDPQPSDRKNVLSAGAKNWTTLGGKCLIGVGHDTYYGGVSGSSGGGEGWQGRMRWWACDSAIEGPNRRGIGIGLHMTDFQWNNPPGHQYGGGVGQKPSNWDAFGQHGGHGGVLYAGVWYDIEVETKLNTIDIANNTWQADGYVRAWVDGVLAFEETGLVFRTPTNTSHPYIPSSLRPCRQLGARDIWWNFFHGGQNPCTKDLESYITGIVLARKRIGVMRKPYPAWKQPVGVSAKIGYAKGLHPVSGKKAVLEEIAPKYMPWAVTPGSDMPWGGLLGKNFNTITDWCSAIWDEDGQKFHGLGAGHVDICVPAPFAHDVGTLEFYWEDIPLPTDGFALTNNVPERTALAAAYTNGQIAGLDADPQRMNVVWRGDSAAWGARKRPGVRQPDVTHTLMDIVHMPWYAVGNVNGALLYASEPSGQGPGSVNIHQRNIFDLDIVQRGTPTPTRRWRPTKNSHRTEYIIGNTGGTVWYGRDIMRGVSLHHGQSSNIDIIYVYNPFTETWGHARSTNGMWTAYGDGGLIPLEESGLLIYVATMQGSNPGASGTNADNLKFWAAPMAAIKAGVVPYPYVAPNLSGPPASFTWTALNVTPPPDGWPTTYTTNTILAVGWTPAPDGCAYATDGRHGSTKLWRLTPPAGVAINDQAGLLAGTWTLPTVSFAPALSLRNPAGVFASGNQFPYSRLRVNKRASNASEIVLMYEPEFYEDQTITITVPAWTG